MELLILDALVLVIRAYHFKEIHKKYPLLEEASTNLETLKILIRLAKDVKTIPDKWYIEYETRLQEIGKMIGGWMKALKETNGK